MTKDKEIEKLKAECEDYLSCSNNWEANANSWREDYHEQQEIINSQSNEIKRLKDEIKKCANFGLGFALCHSDFTSMRNAVKKEQRKLEELAK